MIDTAATGDLYALSRAVFTAFGVEEMKRRPECRYQVRPVPERLGDFDVWIYPDTDGVRVHEGLVKAGYAARLATAEEAADHPPAHAGAALIIVTGAPDVQG